MKRFNEWMEEQEQQAERNFPGHEERSAKAATWIVGGIAGAAAIGCLLAGLLLLFNKGYRAKVEATQ